MTYLIGLLTLAFFVLAVMVVLRMQKVLKGAKTASPDDEDEFFAPNNRINAIMCLVFLVTFTVGTAWSYMVYREDFLPEASTANGRWTDQLFWFSMGLLSIAFLIVNTLIFYFGWKYQYKKGHRATFYTENHKLELIWTAIPAVIMAVLVFTGWRAWSAITSEASADAHKIEIMGKQFNWWVRYGGVEDNKIGKHNYKLTDDTIGNPMGIDFSDEASFDDFMHNSEMHVVVNQEVSLQIRARDVLHSVFIPHMRQKMDAVPGMPTRLKFTPDKTTDQMRSDLNNPNFDYEIACTEVCGKGHFSMRLRLIVEDQASFDKWKASQKPVLASILESNPTFMAKIPENLRTKAMKYAPAPVPDSTIAKTGSATGASASMR